MIDVPKIPVQVTHQIQNSEPESLHPALWSASSAISKSGVQARAMAIMARWAMPPGKLVRGRIGRVEPGPGMPTSCSSSMARWAAEFAIQLLMDLPDFGQLKAHVEHGVEARGGLLKDHGNAIAAQLRDFVLREIQHVPRPSKRISPLTILPGWPSSRSTEKEVTLLPQPDSPTSPTISPRLTRKLTPSTALTTPAYV